jgi:phosphotriesterase-related protein
LLRELSLNSGINIITNTGYYAAANKKYLPEHAFTESAEQLAVRWIDEWVNGINGTDIKPGFIKLGVGKKSLDSIEQKIVRAGALTHLSTGLKIAIHTGSAIAANDELDILEDMGVSPNALIVVHAQNSSSEDQIKLIRRGCWISLDGVNQKPETIAKYIDFLLELKRENLLDHVLISHDDGWSVIQNEDGTIGFELFNFGNGSPYTSIFELLFPRLKELGITQGDFDQLLIKNPAKAFIIEVCEKANS